MRWWWTGFWEQMNLQDFTSVWDLLELLFAEILQFVSQLMNRFSQIIKRDERPEEIIIYVCRFRRSWERLETLQKTEIKLISSTLHPITCSNIRFDWSLVTQSSTFTASASFFSYSLYHITATDSSIWHLHYMWTFRKSCSKAMIRLTIIDNFRAVRYTEASQEPLRHTQVWFDFNTQKHC